MKKRPGLHPGYFYFPRQIALLALNQQAVARCLPT
jgi:hypothetical protein